MAGGEVIIRLGRFPSGQRGQTVNLLVFAFEGSNPSLPRRDFPIGEGISFNPCNVIYNNYENHIINEYQFNVTELFYCNGLRFECTRCSICCRHEPGYVFLSHRDILRLMIASGLKKREIIQRYCRIVELFGIARLSLKEKLNYDCIFWEEGGCSVYAWRPLQCRSFPFWSSSLASEEAWKEVAEFCSGIGRGVLHTKESIEYWLQKRKDEKLIVCDREDDDLSVSSFLHR